LPRNLVVRVGGLVITRQRPETARGFTFLTIEDETGLVNVVVAPAVYRRQRALAGGEPRGGAVNVIARRFWPLSDAAAEPAGHVPSHDFR
jgi:error-prone DNA polymerase